jgi:hypothetical protein
MTQFGENSKQRPRRSEAHAIDQFSTFTCKLETYTLKLEPQPQVDFTWGFSNLKPAASSVST